MPCIIKNELKISKNLTAKEALLPTNKIKFLSAHVRTSIREIDGINKKHADKNLHKLSEGWVRN